MARDRNAKSNAGGIGDVAKTKVPHTDKWAESSHQRDTAITDVDLSVDDGRSDIDKENSPMRAYLLAHSLAL
jgi:hypothetical protein